MRLAEHDLQTELLGNDCTYTGSVKAKLPADDCVLSVTNATCHLPHARQIKDALYCCVPSPLYWLIRNVPYRERIVFVRGEFPTCRIAFFPRSILYTSFFKLIYHLEFFFIDLSYLN